MRLTLLIYTFALLILTACSGDGGGSDPGTPAPPAPTPAPSAANLIFPEDNTECNEGEVLNEEQSSVVFRWSAAENTDSYQITVTNLNTNTPSTVSATGTETPITIDRGTPYSWFVVSRANGTSESATSTTARFFNQGPGIENYAPFPATAINPIRGSTIDPGTLQLQWEGGDIDDDLVDFEVFLDTSNPPASVLTSTSENQTEASVQSGQIYYWRVISRDNAGNSSQSEIFQFSVR